MFYYREDEFKQLNRFLNHSSAKAMAIYGKRRIGKTRLITEYIQTDTSHSVFIYFQCTSYDYHACLTDFLSVVRNTFPDEAYLSSMGF